MRPSKKSKSALTLLCLLFSAFFAYGAYGSEAPTVRIEPIEASAPCHIADMTQKSVIRDYLRAWQGMAAAFQSNQPEALNADFVGTARQKLETTIHQQQQLGITTYYRARRHDLKLVFCSPEGLSVQLVDSVSYDVGLQDHGQTRPAQHVRSQYVAVLSPTETRWKVRVFQGESEH